MKTQKNEQLSALFCISGEMVSMKGEDCYCYANTDEKTLIAVFDGCGGSGSRRYDNYSGYTGAYVASRAVAGAAQKWFEETGADFNGLPGYIDRALDVCTGLGDKQSRLMGSLGISFPTTAAGMVISGSSKKMTADCFWAGDSRCYALDGNGLHQLSVDDIDSKDAYDNLSGDGALTNVISASAQYVLNHKQFLLQSPCILFSATDGCFAYVKTPMEFEYIILETMLRSDNIEQWKQNLNGRILDFAGDDHTLCLAAFGFNDFMDMKRAFAERAKLVYAQFIQSGADERSKWLSYEKSYYMYK
ncbi:MAG: protein phosphatase 2C domain-containing protein [Clostridia bacterium]|nr:protein phosphatase 2C domain-containing protein [Clostridia bacterium]